MAKKATSSKKYSAKASEEVGKALHKLKRGEQRSGTKGKAKSRKQAIAIGLAKARKEGAKVPPQKKQTSNLNVTSKRTTAKKKTARIKRETSAKKATSKRT